MTPETQQSTIRNPSPAKAFATVFLGVFLVVFVAGGVITFMLPERYVTAARVRAATTEELELFRASDTLARVAEQLDLSHAFAQRYGQTEPLSSERTLDIVRRALQVRRIRGTELAEIRVTSLSPGEAAQLANAVAQVGVSNAVKAAAVNAGKAAVIELAVPPSSPVRAHKAFNLVLGALVGAVLGILAGGVGARLAIMPRLGEPEAKES
jgi:capsular polysaccharide biosynthesis protein